MKSGRLRPQSEAEKARFCDIPDDRRARQDSIVVYYSPFHLFITRGRGFGWFQPAIASASHSLQYPVTLWFIPSQAGKIKRHGNKNQRRRVLLVRTLVEKSNAAGSASIPVA
jgi:hypothetical protein